MSDTVTAADLDFEDQEEHEVDRRPTMTTAELLTKLQPILDLVPEPDVDWVGSDGCTHRIVDATLADYDAIVVCGRSLRRIREAVGACGRLDAEGRYLPRGAETVVDRYLARQQAAERAARSARDAKLAEVEAIATEVGAKHGVVPFETLVDLVSERLGAVEDQEEHGVDRRPTMTAAELLPKLQPILDLAPALDDLDRGDDGCTHRFVDATLGDYETIVACEKALGLIKQAVGVCGKRDALGHYLPRAETVLDQDRARQQAAEKAECAAYGANAFVVTMETLVPLAFLAELVSTRLGKRRIRRQPSTTHLRVINGGRNDDG